MSTTVKAGILFVIVSAAIFGVYRILDHIFIKPPPPAPVADFYCPDGVGVVTMGFDAGGVCEDEAIIYSAAQIGCPATKLDQLHSQWPELLIVLSNDDFPCANSPKGCHGTQAGNIITIGTHNALVDEMGHIYWEDCFGSTGETLHLDYPDGGPGNWTSFDSSYQEWCSALYPMMK